MDIIVLHRNEGSVLKIEERHLETMREHADNVYRFQTEEELIASGLDAEILFTWGGRGKPPETWCVNSKRLKWLNTFSAGVDPLMECRIRDLDIIITNAQGIHGFTMGVTTMGYIIYHMRRFDILRKQQEQGISKKLPYLPEDPEGQTVGIVGAGAIGSDVAKFSKALGFNVIGVKRKVIPMENYDEVYSNTDLDKALGKMDYVVILTPMTNDTKHLINADRFKAMKKGAFVINIARGGVVDTNALTEALQSGHLGGCALDAVEPDPLPPDSPLWKMPDVFITPHYSATSPKYVDRAVEQFVKNVDNFKAGRPLFNVIDVAALT